MLEAAHSVHRSSIIVELGGPCLGGHLAHLVVLAPTEPHAAHQVVDQLIHPMQRSSASVLDPANPWL